MSQFNENSYNEIFADTDAPSPANFMEAAVNCAAAMLSVPADTADEVKNRIVQDQLLSMLDQSLTVAAMFGFTGGMLTVPRPPDVTKEYHIPRPVVDRHVVLLKAELEKKGFETSSVARDEYILVLWRVKNADVAAKMGAAGA